MKQTTPDKEKTKVVFRKFKDGDIVAMFPELPAVSHDAWLCTVYAHQGQHGSGDPHLINRTALATSTEYALLKRELESIGYNLTVLSRFPAGSHAVRRAALNEQRKVVS